MTHAFFAARAPFREGGVEDVEANVAMLAATLDALETRSKALTHVHLLEGIKWYGMHLGPYPTPSREDDPRHPPPNFYYNQQDLLSARAAQAGWSWSASRPSYICDFAPLRARNLITVLGTYASICRELQMPLDFPGTDRGYSVLSELSDANCLAEAIIFVATHEAGKNAAFNVTNGDCFRWCQVWPLLAQWFGVPCGVPRRLRLAAWMADKGPVWDRIAERHGLQRRSLERPGIVGIRRLRIREGMGFAVRHRPPQARGVQRLCRHDRDDPRSIGPIPRRPAVATLGFGCLAGKLPPKTPIKAGRPALPAAGPGRKAAKTGNKSCADRGSRCFSRGISKYCRVTRINPQETKWQYR